MPVALLGGLELSLKSLIFDVFWTFGQFSQKRPNAELMPIRLFSGPDPHARLCFFYANSSKIAHGHLTPTLSCLIMMRLYQIEFSVTGVNGYTAGSSLFVFSSFCSEHSEARSQKVP